MTRADKHFDYPEKARPAADSPTDVELARRLNILTNPQLDADCLSSTTPLLRKLLLWGGVAAAGWLLMILQMR